MKLVNLKLYKKEAGNMPSNVLFLCDEQGRDWYESQSQFATDTLKIVVDAAGHIVSFSYDISELWPIGMSVYEINSDEVPEDLDMMNFAYQDGKIIRQELGKELQSQIKL